MQQNNNQGGPRAFRECAADNADRRKLGLGGVQYGDRMTAFQISNLKDYTVNVLKVKTERDLFSYETLSKLKAVLCRWPRPSELRALMKKIDPNYKPLFYMVKMKVITTVAPESAYKIFSTLVGKEGQNFIERTKQDGILYVWLENDKDPSTRHVRIYGVQEKQVKQAAATFIRTAKQMLGDNVVFPKEVPAARELTLIRELAAAPSTLNPKAKAYQYQSPRARKALNPNARSFVLGSK